MSIKFIQVKRGWRGDVAAPFICPAPIPSFGFHPYLKPPARRCWLFYISLRCNAVTHHPPSPSAGRPRHAHLPPSMHYSQPN